MCGLRFVAMSLALPCDKGPLALWLYGHLGSSRNISMNERFCVVCRFGMYTNVLFRCDISHSLDTYETKQCIEDERYFLFICAD